MVWPWSFHCQGLGSIPGQGTKILQAMRCTKRKIHENFSKFCLLLLLLFCFLLCMLLTIMVVKWKNKHNSRNKNEREVGGSKKGS